MPNDVIAELSSAAIRACALGLIAFVGLALFRVRSSAARHATWTVVLFGMLLQIPLGSAIPAVRFKVLRTASVAGQQPMAKMARKPTTAVGLSPANSRSPESRHWISPATVLAGAYFGVMMLFFARMALGLWGLRRILHHAKSLPELGGCCFETAAFVVPASVGCFRPRILLPLGWRDWDAKKLKAVIAHETAHTRRRDWLIALVSRVNVCVFWFHPLAWWMDRELASLAEEACDDIALSEIEDRDQYAATLVEFARAAADHGGLLNWGAVSMAKEGRRLNRIVNWRLAAAKPFGRMAWVALLTCSMPLVYLSAAVQLAPANRPAAGLERPVAPGQSLQAPVSPPRTLIAQSARKQAPRSAQAVSICILIDNSGSMRVNQDEAKAAALALIKAFRPGDEFCIVNFNDESYLSADLTTDFGRARDALTKVESRGGSALRDATQISVDYLVNKAHNRKVLVLITDGSDTSSVASEEQVQDRIRNRGVVVYSIALMNGQDIEKASEGERTLKQLAGVNGGLYYHSDAPADVERIASEIMRDARYK